MKLLSKTLNDFQIIALDGPFGRINDFYFDDTEMKVTHAEIRCGSILKKMYKPIPIKYIQYIDLANKEVIMNLLKHYIEHSPNTESLTSLPSDIFERHWERYYSNRSGSSALNYIGPLGPRPKMEAMKSSEEVHSLKYLNGFNVEDTDGIIGKSDGSIVNWETFQISSLIFKKGTFFLTKKKKIGIEWIRNINWNEKYISIETNRSHTNTLSKFCKTDCESTLTYPIEVNYNGIAHIPANLRKISPK
ncbi:MAG: hypothetical protein KDD61_03890 [Bdellovibrionales bacterium]|nr:hypothetical protein [Bdellovibrionales bacterium]